MLPGSRNSPRRSASPTTLPPCAASPPARRSGLSRQALVLVLLIAVAFGTAVYMGVRHPYRTPVAARPAEPLRMTVVPLAPEGAVPGARDVALLYAHSPAAGFRAGAEGVPSRRPGAPLTSPTTRW